MASSFWLFTFHPLQKHQRCTSVHLHFFSIYVFFKVFRTTDFFSSCPSRKLVSSTPRFRSRGLVSQLLSDARSSHHITKFPRTLRGRPAGRCSINFGAALISFGEENRQSILPHTTATGGRAVVFLLWFPCGNRDRERARCGNRERSASVYPQLPC